MHSWLRGSIPAWSLDPDHAGVRQEDHHLPLQEVHDYQLLPPRHQQDSRDIEIGDFYCSLKKNSFNFIFSSSLVNGTIGTKLCDAKLVLKTLLGEMAVLLGGLSVVHGRVVGEENESDVFSKTDMAGL